MQKLMSFFAVAAASSLFLVAQSANATWCPPQHGGSSVGDCVYEVEFKGGGQEYTSKNFTAENVNNVSADQSVNIKAYTAPTTNNWQQVTFNTWSTGIGIQNSSGDGSHTIDNVGWTDAVLLSFDHDVSLLDITLSRYGDSDISIYESSVGDPTDWSSWSLIDDYQGSYASNGSQYTHDFDSNGDDVGIGSSSYYLLTAMNGSSDRDDLFKLLALTYCEHPDNTPPTSEVPAPAGLLLLLAGLPLLRRMRRK